mgnify:FL=1|jgi:hypothetical protein
MAGKQLKKTILADVAKKGGAEYVREMASSMTLKAWAAQEWKCSRNYLSETIRSVPEYARVLEAAQSVLADAMMEENVEIADSIPETASSTQIAKVREQMQARKMLAAGLNRDRYGSGPRAEITLNLGDLHLDALRKISSDRQALMAEDREREMKVIEHDE